MTQAVKVGALFTLNRVASDGITVIETTNPFHNLVLNSGLNRMGTGGYISGCAVGSGNSEPDVNQTKLDTQVAWTTTVLGGSSVKLQKSELPYYYEWSTTYRFAQGAAAGNLSEIGVGWGSDKMWNRTLIKGLDGQPTTITILPNEFLDVLVQYRIYPNTNDVVGSVDLVDDTGKVVSTHKVTVRPNLTNGTPFEASITPNERVLFHGGVPARVAMSSGAMGDMFTLPAGMFNGNYQGVHQPSYVDGSYSIVGQTNHSISADNNSHRSVLMPSRLGYFKFEYDPPITKDNTQTLNHNFTLSWGRYDATRE